MLSNIIKNRNPNLYNKLECLREKIKEVEVIRMKIKAVNFINMQSFSNVYKNYAVGEVIKVKGVGYSIVISKTIEEIKFVVIMRLNSIR
jgi:hypothetical protein